MTRPDVVLPSRLAAAVERDNRHAWVRALPAIVTAAEVQWEIEVGRPFEPGGDAAWVAPAARRRGGEAVLKVVWPHPEARDEADALELWAGEGAVHLQGRGDFVGTRALLLERCRPGTTLAERPEAEQHVVVAGLLRRLWQAPFPPDRFRPLEAMCAQWADEAEHQHAERPTLDPGLVREGLALFRSLSTDGDDPVLLATDLHAGNILAAEREPWLVIDPKPYVGDRTYDALQHVLNCPDRLHADPRRLADEVADQLELDRDRLLLWLFARCVQQCPTWPGLNAVAVALAPA